jgi:hypothetical protein
MFSKKRLASVALAASLAAGMIAAGPAYGATAIDGSGSVHCSFTGSIKFSPALKDGGSTPATASIKGKTSGCTGGGADGGNIVSGTISGSVHSPSNDCTTAFGALVGGIGYSTKWKVAKKTAKQNPTVQAFPAYTLNEDGTVDLTGSATSGSYNGDSATTHLVIDLTALGGCSTKKGVKGMNIQSGSSLDLSDAS